MDNANNVNKQITAGNGITANISTEKVLKKYTGVAGRVLSQLSAGATQAEVALACGVDKSYVSQLCAEEDFQKQIQQNIVKATTRAIEIDDNYEEIEKIATDSLKRLMPLMHTPSELIKLAQMANQAKKKVAPKSVNPDENGNNVGRILRVIMPSVIINNYTMNPNSEIVAVGDRQLTTLNSASMTSLMNKHKDEQVIEQNEINSKPALIDAPKGKSNEFKDKWSNL